MTKGTTEDWRAHLSDVQCRAVMLHGVAEGAALLMNEGAEGAVIANLEAMSRETRWIADALEAVEVAARREPSTGSIASEARANREHLDFEVGRLENARAMLDNASWSVLSNGPLDKPMKQADVAAMIGAVEAMGLAVDRVVAALDGEAEKAA